MLIKNLPITSKEINIKPITSNKNPVMKKSIFFTVVLTLFVLGCSKKEEVKVSMPPTPAEFVISQSKVVNEYISTMGTIASSSSVNIVAQVSGQIVSVNFKQGQEVKKGDVLAVIDKRPYRAALLKAQGQLKQALAQLKIDELSVERNKKLAKDGYVDKQTFDSLLAKVEVDKGVVEASQAAVDTAKINLDWCDIKAPVDGKVGLYNINVGNVVSSGTSVITTIENVDKLYVDFVVPSQKLFDIQNFMRENSGKLTVEVSYIEEGMGNRKIQAHADVVLNKIRYESGTAVLRGSFDNSQKLFWPNQPVRVKLNLNEIKDAVLIPDICIQLNAAGPFVYLATPVKDGVYTVKMVQIKKGQLFDGMRAVQGIKGNEKIILRISQLRLQAGPFVYEATSQGAIVGADGKPILEQKAMVDFMANATKIADSLRAEYFKKVMQSASKNRDLKAEVKKATQEAVSQSWQSNK